MKININEKYFYAIIIIVVTFFSLTLITPRSDNYFTYYVSRELLRNPDFIWKPVDSVRSFVIASGDPGGVFKYPPLTMLLYTILIFFSMPPILLIVISFMIIVFFTYKLNNRAVPLLFISFLFLRSVIQGESDVLVVAFALASVYFFDKNPLISGIFASLAFLSKQTGVAVVGWFILSTLIFKRREFGFSLKNKRVLSIVTVILIISVWYARNYILGGGDIVEMITGQKLSYIKSSEEMLRSGIQVNSPETYFIDTTGYYPNPIDLLLVLGIVFLVVDLFRKRKLDHINLFVILPLIVYITAQVLSIKALMTIRYYLFMFPLLAVIVANNLKEKYFKYLLVISIVIFIFYISSLQKYAFNQLRDQIVTACPQIKQAVGMNLVYVDFFHLMIVAYECDLNLTDLNHSVFVVNLTSGAIYPTNKSV